MAANQSRVFISYQRTDGEFARQVRAHLVARGVDTWMDEFDIPVGAYWPDEIDRGLASSDIVVGIISPDAIASRNVKNEWDWALANGKRLLLLMTRPTDIPHRYISINYIDATGAARDSALADLAQTLGVAGDAGAGGLADEPTPTTPHTTVRHGARRSARAYPAPPFLTGREQEQATVLERLDAMSAGHGSLVMIGGAAGIGKTTFVSWLGWAAEERGAVVLSGACYDLATTPPYGPWGRLTANWPDDPALPVLPDEFRAGTGMGAIRNQTEFFALFEEFLTAACEVRPLLLLLEDLHWVDQASLDLLRHLSRNLGSKRLMLVITYRDEELTRGHPLTQSLPALVREAAAARVTLAPLGQAATRELIAARYQLSAPDADRLSGYVHRLAEGNPFFSEEILRALEEDAAIQRAGETWRLANLDRAQVPSLVRQVIEGRLERLGDDATRLLQVAAVIGQEAPVDLWVEVSEADDEALAVALERGTEARLIEEMDGGSSFRFTHALIRETLYEGLVSLRRRRWHRVVAEAIERTARPDPDMVAHHFEQANDPRAYDWLARAAQRAMSTFAWRMAVERWERAAAVLEGDDTRDRELGWLLFQMGTLMRYASRQGSLDYLVEARRIGVETGDELLTAAARANQGFVLLFSGHGDQGLAEIRAGVEIYDRLGPQSIDAAPSFIDRAYMASLMEERRAMQAPGLAAFGQYADALQICDELTSNDDRRATLASIVGPRLTTSGFGNALMGRGMALASLGRPDEAAHAYEESLSHYANNGFTNPFVIGICAFYMLHTVDLPYRADQSDRLEKSTRQGVDAWISARGTTAEGRSPRYAMLGALLLHGDWDEALELAEAGVAGEIHFGLWDEAARVLGVLGYCRGDVEQAWEQIARYFPEGPGSPGRALYHPVATALQRLAASLALDAGDLPAAEGWLDAHRARMEWSGAVLGRPEESALRARYHLALGDADLAREHAQSSLEHAREPRQPVALIEAHRLLGELAGREGNARDAREHFSMSIDIAESCRAPFERALTLLAMAEASVEWGSVEDATRALETARALCEPLGARPALARIAALEGLLTEQ